VAPQLPDGESWDAHRDTVADLMIDTVNAHAPTQGLRARPSDHESARSGAHLRLIGGDISHGTLSLDQLFSARPMLGYGNYRGPLQGFTCAAPARIPGAA